MSSDKYREARNLERRLKRQLLTYLGLAGLKTGLNVVTNPQGIPDPLNRHLRAMSKEDRDLYSPGEALNFVKGGYAQYSVDEFKTTNINHQNLIPVSSYLQFRELGYNKNQAKREYWRQFRVSSKDYLTVKSFNEVLFKFNATLAYIDKQLYKETEYWRGRKLSAERRNAKRAKKNRPPIDVPDITNVTLDLKTRDANPQFIFTVDSGLHGRLSKNFNELAVQASSIPFLLKNIPADKVNSVKQLGGGNSSVVLTNDMADLLDSDSIQDAAAASGIDISSFPITEGYTIAPRNNLQTLLHKARTLNDNKLPDDVVNILNRNSEFEYEVIYPSYLSVNAKMEARNEAISIKRIQRPSAGNESYLEVLRSRPKEKIKVVELSRRFTSQENFEDEWNELSLKGDYTFNVEISEIKSILVSSIISILTYNANYIVPNTNRSAGALVSQAESDEHNYEALKRNIVLADQSKGRTILESHRENIESQLLSALDGLAKSYRLYGQGDREQDSIIKRRDDAWKAGDTHDVIVHQFLDDITRVDAEGVADGLRVMEELMREYNNKIDRVAEKDEEELRRQSDLMNTALSSTTGGGL